MTPQTLALPAPEARRPRWRVRGVLRRRDGRRWRRLLYAVLTLPLGAAYALLVVGLVAAVATFLQVVGVLLLPVVLALVRGLGGLERRQATWLLGVDVEPGLALRREKVRPLQRVRMLLTAGSTWRTAAWLAARVLLGAAVAATVTAVTAAWLAWVFEAPWANGSVGSLAAVLLTVALGVLVLAAVDLQVRVAAAVAPRLLGASQEERLVALQRASQRLADRNRLARDLHDTIGHTLTASLLQAEAARRMLAPAPADPDRPLDVAFARQALEHIESNTRDALAELDQALAVLRGGAGTGRGDGPSLPAADLTCLDELVAGLCDGGLPVALTVEGPVGDVPAAVSEVAYRVVQEGTTNVLRHAGSTPTAVRVTARSNAVVVRVGNDPGFPRVRRPGPGGGRGLQGLRERVTAVGGELTTGPLPGGGFVVEALLPLPRRR